MTQAWMMYAGLSLFFWGLWGVFGKMASQTLPARSVFLAEAIVVAIVAVAFMAFSGFKIELQEKGWGWALLTGLTLAFGQLCFFLALSRGKVSLVLGLTSLYPLITILIAFLFLHERVSWTQGIGLALAAVAIPLLSF